MKKGDVVTGKVIDLEFPGKGIVCIPDEERKAIVKNVLPGQTISFRVTKKRSDKIEGNLLEVISKAPNEINPACPHFPVCGGCQYQNLTYDDQINLKNKQVVDIFEPAITKYLNHNNIETDCNRDEYFKSIFEGTIMSPVNSEYRNKMEFSFGDGCKGGELELGLHKKGSFYDILTVKDCKIVDEDFRRILSETLSYFKGKECTYFHKISHEGFLRHLLIRKAVRTGEILVCLVTTSDIPKDTPCTEISIIDDWKEMICGLKLNGTLAGVLHIINNSLSDVVQSDDTRVLYGNDYIYEEILGLRFKISPFSFFQTNSLSAEVIYNKVREYIQQTSSLDGKTVFDLYSGTGTIAQMVAPVCEKVVGVEIVSEAVEAAKENAKLNGIDNCEFIAGDVLKELDNISKKPDFIILDPPRDGVHPKALRKIIDYGVDNIIYIACKPTSLARDLEVFMGNGYIPVKMCAVDQFPSTNHVEVVTLLCRQKQ